MESIDAIQVNFNPDQLLLLNLCLAFLMFGVALDIRVSDFWRLFKNPKAPIIGLISQLILLPILTLGLIYVFQPPASMGLGMMLVGICPGGNVSNFMVHMSKGNSALSVMMTSITTLGAVIITPFYFSFWVSYIPNSEKFSKLIYVNPYDMMETIFLLIIIPLILGMWLLHKYPGFVDKIRKPVSRLSIFIFMSFVIVALFLNLQNAQDHLGKVFWVVLVHNSLALALGFTWAKLNGLSNFDARAISIETGIQNSGLALILIFNFFDGLGGMALVAAWWGIWHLISGFSLAMFWRSR